MRRLLPTVAVVVVALGGAAAATGASGPVFTIVPSTQTVAPLASAETPNVSGGLVLPPFGGGPSGLNIPGPNFGPSLPTTGPDFGALAPKAPDATPVEPAKAEAPKAEEPKTEQPKAEEPKAAEEPKPAEPK